MYLLYTYIHKTVVVHVYIIGLFNYGYLNYNRNINKPVENYHNTRAYNIKNNWHNNIIVEFILSYSKYKENPYEKQNKNKTISKHRAYIYLFL